MNASHQTHPSREQLAAFTAGKLNALESDEIEQHLSECDSCCHLLTDLPDEDTLTGLLRDDTSVSPDDADSFARTIVPEPKASTNAPHDQATLLPEGDTAGPPLDLPQELRDHGRYRIVRLIGRGGMGDVYEAEHRVMNRPVALKVIKPKLVRNDSAVRRFRREVQAAARLRHPNIVTAFDAEQAGDLHYLVMEFVDGVDLDDVIKDRGPLPVEEACDYIRQTAEGLQHAHELGMVHRDIKPHNLMVEGQELRDKSRNSPELRVQRQEPDTRGASGSPQPSVKILDFGLANFANETAAEEIDAVDSADPTFAGAEVLNHLTQAGTMMGTPDYIAPEQAKDAHNADIRSDIYSLGCTFYTLLTGKTPFSDGSVLEKIKAHTEANAPPISEFRDDVPAEVAAILKKMMAKDPAERYQTPQEVAEALGSSISRKNEGQPASNVASGRQLNAAAYGLMAVGVLNVIQMIVFLYNVDAFADNAWPDWLALPFGFGSLFALPLGLFVVWGGWRMRTRRSYGWSMAAVIAAIMPITPVNICFGLSIGIWSLILLTSPTIKAEFGIGVPVESSDRGRSIRGWLAAIAVVAAMLVPASIYYVQTDYGVVRIEVADDSLEVQLAGETITAKDGEKEISIRPGENKLFVKRGDFDFYTDSFELRRGEKISLKVELMPGEIVVQRDGKRFGAEKIDRDKMIARISQIKTETGTEIFINGEKVGDVADLLAQLSSLVQKNPNLEIKLEPEIVDREADVELVQKLAQAPVANNLELHPDWKRLLSELSLPSVTNMRLEALKTRRKNQLKQIGIALHNYHDTYGSLPPAAGHQRPNFDPKGKFDVEGRPFLSWRVYILPAFENGQELFDQFHLDEPWDSEHNVKLLDQMPAVFKTTDDPTKTTFLSVVGDGTMYEGKAGLRFADATDGLSNTAIVVDAGPERAVPWTKPEDLPFDSEDPIRAFAASEFGNVFLAVMADGSVQEIPYDTAPEQLRNLFLRADNNRLDLTKKRDTPLPSPARNEITLIKKLKRSTNNIDSLAYSPDGKFLFVGSAEKVIYQWDVATETIIRQIPVGDFPRSLAVHPDGRHIFTGGYAGGVIMWSLDNGRPVQEFNGHAKSVESLAVSSNGKRLLSASPDGFARLWDVETAKILQEFSETYSHGAALSSDGRLAAHAMPSGVRIWETESGKSLHELQTGNRSPVSALAFSPDGKDLVSGDYRGQIQVWNVKTGRELHRFDKQTDRIASIVFTSDGRHFMAGSWDRSLKIFDLNRGVESHVMKAETLCVSYLAVSPDGKALATAGGMRFERVNGEYIIHKDDDYDVRIWRLPESVWPKDKTGVKSKQSIKKGLDYLAKTQHKDGHWETENPKKSAATFPVAMTALAGMTMLMEGSTLEYGLYSDNLQRAVNWLMAQSQEDGRLVDPTLESNYRYMFGHGYAMLFLSSVYAQEEDGPRKRKLKEILTKAVLFTEKARTTRGGWGYVAASEGNNFDEAATSIVQLQALRAARNAGIHIPRGLIDAEYLRKFTGPTGGVVYSLFAKTLQERPALTAAALAGCEYDAELFKKWLKFVQKNIPADGENAIGHRDYTHYYLAQALYILGDDGYGKLFPESKPEDRLTWSRYRETVFDGIIARQEADGSWSDNQIGPVYGTACNLTVLQLEDDVVPIYRRAPGNN